jgi:hypothetical protein
MVVYKTGGSPERAEAARQASKLFRWQTEVAMLIEIYIKLLNLITD